MPTANNPGFAVQRFKRMRRLQQQHRVTRGFPLHEIARAADIAAASLGLDAILRQGDALLQELGAQQAGAEVAPGDQLAQLEPLTTDH